MLQYGLFVALLVVLVLFCGSGYENTSESRSLNYDSRAQLSYIANRVGAGDAAGCVSVREDKALLVLTDQTASGNYETRFYLDAGRLLEEYSKSDAPLNPEKAGVIGETALFTAEINNSVLTVKTDSGVIAVALHAQP